MLLLTKKLLSQGFLGVKFESPLRKLKVTTMIWLTAPNGEQFLFLHVTLVTNPVKRHK
jgi:hypothetical protein